MTAPQGTSSSTAYAQAMVDQRPVYDNAVRKGKVKKKRKKRHGY